MYNTKTNLGSIHAEEDAINKLQKRPNNKKIKNVNIVVIRTTNNGNFGMSKPCVHCIIKMCTQALKLGYAIRKISYTNEEGKLLTTTLNKMITEGDFHVSKYFMNHKFNY